MLLTETHLRCKDKQRMKERDGKKTCHANGMQNKVGITILI